MPIRPALALLALAAPAFADGHDEFAGTRLAGNIVDLAGETIGSVTAVETESGIVLITIQATGLEPGTHGVHLHETGACDGDFASAGGHIAGDANHGLVAGGPHPGDLPNGFVGTDGELAMQAFNDRISVTADLLDADGAALIVHSSADDHVSQPAGAAGDRVACAILDAVPAAEEG
ncbi:MAG: superoxide dismutase family protein [Pseudomonadota bacterium]